MVDIFLSYSNSDRGKAQVLAEALSLQSWTVWWDRNIPYGQSFDEVIEQKLDEAKCVIVLWSKESVLSKWVKAEASEAAKRNVLTPVLLEIGLKIPLEFRLMQAANLSDWEPDKPHNEFQQLLKQLASMLGSPSPQGSYQTSLESLHGIKSTPEGGVTEKADSIKPQSIFSRNLPGMILGSVLLTLIVAGIWLWPKAPSHPVTPSILEPGTLTPSSAANNDQASLQKGALDDIRDFQSQQSSPDPDLLAKIEEVENLLAKIKIQAEGSVSQRQRSTNAELDAEIAKQENLLTQIRGSTTTTVEKKKTLQQLKEEIRLLGTR